MTQYDIQDNFVQRFGRKGSLYFSPGRINLIGEHTDYNGGHVFPCALSFGIWGDVQLFGMGFFDLFDFLVAKLFMPVGAFLICLFVGWVVDEKVLRAELTNNGSIHQPLYPAYRFIVRYLAPVCILLIFLNELGLF